MNREDIIAMAREAGATPYTNRHYPDRPTHTFNPEQLERFAALVAAATAKEYEERLRFTRERWEIECQSQVEIEREACAKVVGEFAQKWWSAHCASNKHMETTRKAHDDFCALQAAIRARGQA